MNKTMFSPHLLLFLPCSFLFLLFSFILEYLRVAVRLGWNCFLSFHLLFPEFYSLIIFSEKSSKIKFLEKFQKNPFKILCQKWGREAPGRPQGDPPCHLTTRGAAQAWPRPPMVRGAPWPSTYLSTLTSFSLPKYLNTPAQTRVLAALHRDFSISLLSPSLLLRFGAIVLRYVTPSSVQVEFCLVEYFLSILDL
jgi:hypothetical protein